MDKVTDTVAFVQHWLMNTDHEPSQFDRDFAAAIDARVIATTAKQLAETFCATPLPDDACADQCATMQGPGRYGTNLLTVAQAEHVFAVALATPAPDSEKLREALTEARNAPMIDHSGQKRGVYDILDRILAALGASL